ncbi:cytochrome b [Leucobacter luti]|uniref:Cytochrome bc1 complex cytochrome b subunit n=1 Tax=Leucobacter luti TaxID=340320 RepID=A0A4V2FNE7_9MICO|nr:cytochrome bc complex cytochrome b subunit [Leucobacter luti]MBL3700257.1 cytochrome bc complex cytochrome b subunit [Leucobacter luti]RZT61019.1 menaquinol-cytochrome c reductase cytochrome b subunit precursor [Leucobacter luti]
MKTEGDRPTAQGPSRFTTAAAEYLDARTGIGVAVKKLGRKAFPDHWSFLLGEIALWSFIAILLSGTFLALFFQATMVETHYNGPFVPMKGVEMSGALASTLDISFSVRGGLLMRQVHHWGALLFVAAIGLHMLRIFFTGAFRKPRELNWVIGFTLFILAIAEGLTGYSLPDDVLSGNGLRIIDGLIKSIPVVGTYLSQFLFGGEFPGTDLVGRFYMLHIMLLPSLVILLVALHITFVAIHTHSHYPGPGRGQTRVVGYPVLPFYAAKAGGFFFIVFGVIVLISSLFGINAVWAYGPYDPSPVSAGTQPDWYAGFADGILRLVPPGWETEWFGYTWSWNLLIPILILGLFFVLVALYPFIEAWVTGDKREHHILDRPRNAPTRTAIGAAGVTFYAIMWAAASSDLIATHFQLSIEGVIHALQASLILGPIVAYFIAKRICIGLQKKDRMIALHGVESGRIVRLPDGEYIEVHTPLTEHERWKIVSYHDYAPLVLRPNDDGRIPFSKRLRVGLSRWFFEDRIVPPTASELAEHQGPEHKGTQSADPDSGGAQ